MVARLVRPGYFNWPWDSVTVPVKVDLTSGSSFKNFDSPGLTCLEFLKRHYPDYVTICTDGTVDRDSGRVGCGFYVQRDNYALALQSFTTVHSAEIYAVLRAIHYYSHFAMNRVLILIL